jgi:hypothetical protein
VTAHVVSAVAILVVLIGAVAWMWRLERSIRRRS